MSALRGPLVLASGSPRRRALLRGLGLRFAVVEPSVDETPRSGEAPQAYARRIALDKARKVFREHPGGAVLAADTIVVLRGRILGKPRGPRDAAATLRQLSGRTHDVFTALAVLSPKGQALRIVKTRVRFRKLAPRQIEWYVGTREPMDKAGSYAIQGKGGVLVASIQGSHSNVIGLPLGETVQVLRTAGVALPWT
jgi:septum formation protein